MGGRRIGMGSRIGMGMLMEGEWSSLCLHKPKVLGLELLSLA